jgi:hypothetical protein
MVQAIIGLAKAMALAFEKDTQNNVPSGPTSGVKHEK